MTASASVTTSHTVRNGFCAAARPAGPSRHVRQLAISVNLSFHG